MARMRSISSGSMERKPSSIPTVMGKNVATTMSTTLGSIP